VPTNVTLISGDQKLAVCWCVAAHLHLVPQRIDGSLYFLAYRTNHRLRPTAALLKPRPDGGLPPFALSTAPKRFSDQRPKNFGGNGNSFNQPLSLIRHEHPMARPR
jgi:hypothetical protein